MIESNTICSMTLLSDPSTKNQKTGSNKRNSSTMAERPSKQAERDPWSARLTVVRGAIGTIETVQAASRDRAAFSLRSGNQGDWTQK